MIISFISALVIHFKIQLVSLCLWLLLFFCLVNMLGSFKVILISITLVLIVIALALRYGWVKDVNDHLSESSVKNENVNVDINTPHARYQCTSTLCSNSIYCYLIKNDAKKSSNCYIYGAFWACLVVQLWRHMWLLHLLPIPLVCYLLKWFGSYLNLWAFLCNQQSIFIDTFSSWFLSYKDQIFPIPLQWISKVLIECFF